MVNKALNSYFMKESIKEGTLFDLDREDIEKNISRIWYVSDEEQKEIEESLSNMSDEDKEIAFTSRVYL